MAAHRRMLRWGFDSEESCEEYMCTPTQPPLPVVVPIPPAPSGGGHHHGRLPNILFVIAAVLAAFLLLSLTYFAVLRRYRRRRAGLLRPIYSVEGGGLGALAAAPPFDEDAVSVDEGAEQPLHHVWYIRTVGLDEGTINSIAVAEYRAREGGLLGCSAADCSVCLGEFSDGELVRLLPKCGHAFHVPCIDTWLRAHVNCPLCRALVVDPNALPDAITASTVDPPTDAVVGSVDVDQESSDTVQGPQLVSQSSEEEQTRGSLDCVIEIDAPANPAGVLDSPPECSVARGQTDADDSPAMDAAVLRPEGSLGGGEEAKDASLGEESAPKIKGRHGNCSKVVSERKANLEIERSLSSSGRGFIFSRNGRFGRNSSLPS